jgi:hypothetical protein
LLRAFDILKFTVVPERRATQTTVSARHREGMLPYALRVNVCPPGTVNELILIVVHLTAAVTSLRLLIVPVQRLLKDSESSVGIAE